MSTPIRPPATGGWSSGRAAGCIFVKVSFIALRIPSLACGGLYDTHVKGRARKNNTPMLNRRTFLASCASTLALLASWRPARAQTRPANITFVLFNHFYRMGGQPLPDGGRRGGF